MDRLIYVAMSGAKQMMERQATVAHNLANASTAGYRADVNTFRVAYLNGPGLATRAFVADSTSGVDFRPGPIQQTGRDLDVAIQGKGWIAVQMPDGSEAYTRAGSLQITADGQLQTPDGNAVLGDGGPISIPQDTKVVIGSDGTITAVPFGNKPSTASTVGRIKLVNPDEGLLTKGGDGLFRLKDGSQPEVDDNVKLLSGAVEGSNVNPVDAMVDMIATARQYEMNVQLLQSATQNASDASKLLDING